jgi:hypothetical protein
MWGMRALMTASQKAFINKTIEFLTLITMAISVLILWLQLRDIDKTLESQNSLLESQAYNYIESGLLELDKIFIEKSEYRPYFFENCSLPSKEVERQRVLAIADMKLDYMDSFYSQESRINWNRYTRSGWDEYFRDSFRRSIVLRQAFCNYQEQYGLELRAFASGTCEGPNAKEDPKEVKPSGPPCQN